MHFSHGLCFRCDPQLFPSLRLQFKSLCISSFQALFCADPLLLCCFKILSTAICNLTLHSCQNMATLFLTNSDCQRLKCVSHLSGHFPVKINTNFLLQLVQITKSVTHLWFSANKKHSLKLKDLTEQTNDSMCDVSHG